MSEYFVLEKDKQELANNCMGRIRSVGLMLKNSDFRYSTIKNNRYYHGKYFDSQSAFNEDIISIDDEQSIKATTLNHFRNVIRHQINMITQNRPSFDVMADHTTLKSMQRARKGKAIVNNQLDKNGLETELYRACEKATVGNMSFLTAEWNPVLGEMYGYSEGEASYKGDYEFRALWALDVFFDVTQKRWEDCKWKAYRYRKNKYDLMAMFPKEKEKIARIDPILDIDEMELSIDYEDTSQYLYGDFKDDIWVYHFYHEKTPAVPEGKFLIMCGGYEDVVHLYSSDMFYEAAPIFRMVPSERLESPLGYSEANSIRGPQEIVTLAVSSAVTALEAWGVGNVWAPAGSNLSVTQLSDSVNLIESDSDQKPEMLRLLDIPPEAIGMLDKAVSSIETLSGINATVRGKPEVNLKSGIAIALVQSMAQNFSNQLEREYTKLLEAVGSHVLRTEAIVAKVKRSIVVPGSGKRFERVEYDKNDLDGISGVTVRVGNPMSRTYAGRVAMAEHLIQGGMVKTPQQYIAVLETGNVDILTETPEKEIEFVKRENELLLELRPVRALMGDDHQLHINEHLSLTFDEELRQAEEGTEEMQRLMVILEHIQEHKDIMTNGDTVFMARNGMVPPALTPGIDEVKNPADQKTMIDQQEDRASELQQQTQMQTQRPPSA